MAFNCTMLFPLHIFSLFRYAGKREAKAKQGRLHGGGSGWKKGCSTPLGIWVTVDGARATFILVPFVTHRGSDQTPGPSICSLEFEWFISRPSEVWSSVLHQGPAYHSSDMASLSKCLALLDSGWVLYWLLTLNKHLVFITNGSRPERGAALGGAVT